MFWMMIKQKNQEGKTGRSQRLLFGLLVCLLVLVRLYCYILVKKTETFAKTQQQTSQNERFLRDIRKKGNL